MNPNQWDPLLDACDQPRDCNAGGIGTAGPSGDPTTIFVRFFGSQNTYEFCSGMLSYFRLNQTPASGNRSQCWVIDENMCWLTSGNVFLLEDYVNYCRPKFIIGKYKLHIHHRLLLFGRAFLRLDSIGTSDRRTAIGRRTALQFTDVSALRCSSARR